MAAPPLFDQTVDNVRLVVRLNEKWVSDLDTAIARGVEALDKYFGDPGWVHNVNLERFNLESGSLCVCGQLFADDANGQIVTLPTGYNMPLEEGYVFALHQLMESWWNSTGNGKEYDNLDYMERMDSYSKRLGFVIDEDSGPYIYQWSVDGVEKSEHYHWELTDDFWDAGHDGPWEFATRRWSDKIIELRERVPVTV